MKRSKRLHFMKIVIFGSMLHFLTTTQLRVFHAKVPPMSFIWTAAIEITHLFFFYSSVFLFLFLFVFKKLWRIYVLIRKRVPEFHSNILSWAKTVVVTDCSIFCCFYIILESDHGDGLKDSIATASNRQTSTSSLSMCMIQRLTNLMESQIDQWAAGNRRI